MKNMCAVLVSSFRWKLAAHLYNELTGTGKIYGHIGELESCHIMASGGEMDSVVVVSWLWKYMDKGEMNVNGAN